MVWWRWLDASIATGLVVLLLALRLDTLRERLATTEALRRLAPWVVVVPVVFLVVLVVPWWLGLILIAIPAVALLAMAAAS